MAERRAHLRQAEEVDLDDLVAQLADRVPALDLRRAGPSPVATGAVHLSTAVHDSRRVVPGALFCCVPGTRYDGHDHAAQAVADGAAALLVERVLDLPVPQLVVGSVRRAMGPVAAALAGRPAEHLAIVGVTGTNGKTTTTQMLGTILSEAGRRCEVVGTLSGVRTTPEAPELQALLAGFVADGVTDVAMEVSSHALEQHRVDGASFDVVGFTNLSRDHLDHHGDMTAYFKAKARLFEPELAARAVLNLDDPYGRLLFDSAQIPSVGFSMDDAEGLELGAQGSRFGWRGQRIELPLAGRFNVSNALAAATLADQLGVDGGAIAAGLSGLAPIPGRLERVDAGQPFLALVDFAHTPDGLEQLLESLRELAGDGKVVVVFGAGGDRDPSKRPEMGEVVSRLADVAVLTTDNPRHEDPAAIMSQVRNGMEGPAELIMEPDRREAIDRAVALVSSGDVLVIAGKGHETTQVSGDQVTPFDDRLVLRDALSAAQGGGTR